MARVLTTQYRMHLTISEWASHVRRSRSQIRKRVQKRRESKFTSKDGLQKGFTFLSILLTFTFKAMYGGRLEAAEAVRNHTLGDLVSSSSSSELAIHQREREVESGADDIGAGCGGSGDVGNEKLCNEIEIDDNDDNDLALVRAPLLFIDTSGCEMYEDGDDAEDYTTAKKTTTKTMKKKAAAVAASAGTGAGDGGTSGNDADGSDDDDDCNGHTSVVKGVVVASRSNRQEADVVVEHVLR